VIFYGYFYGLIIPEMGLFTDLQQVFWAIIVSHHADRFETRRQKRFAYQETYTVRTSE
jgi:hypothetical protein